MKLNEEAPEAPFILSFRKGIITTNAGLMILSVSMQICGTASVLQSFLRKHCRIFIITVLQRSAPMILKSLKSCQNARSSGRMSFPSCRHGLRSALKITRFSQYAEYNTKHQLKTIQKIEHNLAYMDYVMIFCL